MTLVPLDWDQDSTEWLWVRPRGEVFDAGRSHAEFQTFAIRDIAAFGEYFIRDPDDPAGLYNVLVFPDRIGLLPSDATNRSDLLAALSCYWGLAIAELPADWEVGENFRSSRILWPVDHRGLQILQYRPVGGSMEKPSKFERFWRWFWPKEDEVYGVISPAVQRLAQKARANSGES